MTSWALRPARRARNAPMVWIPSCELPAKRMTASRICSGRRSARPADVGVADSGKTWEELTVWVFENANRTNGLLSKKEYKEFEKLQEFKERNRKAAATQSLEWSR